MGLALLAYPIYLMMCAKWWLPIFVHENHNDYDKWLHYVWTQSNANWWHKHWFTEAEAYSHRCMITNLNHWLVDYTASKNWDLNFNSNLIWNVYVMHWIELIISIRWLVWVWVIIMDQMLQNALWLWTLILKYSHSTVIRRNWPWQ